MKLKKVTKRILASITVATMAFTGVFTEGVISSIQPVYADTQDAQTSEETAEAGTDATLIEDTQDSEMWYNSNSDLRDFRDETIYFVMTTRFYDGDPSNNVQCWDGTSYNGDETPWKGDFKGLIEKLDYIKALGFTAIWITPVVKNASGYDYHGYHAINFKEVDSRYESTDCTYQDLIDAVHARGMKIIQDVVFNHTGNFGEENLMPLFSRDDSADLAEITECMIPNEEYLPSASDYYSLLPGTQYDMRLDYMKDHLKLDKKKVNDPDNLWHHWGDFNWDDYTCQLAQIAGDCVDLNTENPKVYKYLVDAYSQYIKMGVDAFRVDTVRHMSRLSLNNGFISQLNDAYNEVHGTTGERNFYMFGEVCTRYSSVWYREVPALSTPFYTWKESKEYPWIDDETDPDAYITNMASAEEHYNDNQSNISEQPTSDNAFLDGNDYHTPDYTMSSGLDVIDFPMHWNFKEASGAYNIAVSSDKYYNDATYNVVYVDSHDYAPDHAPEDQRYAGSQEQWAENLSLMFTFRGIPCIYYGSEVEFMKGAAIDKGPNININETGRAYFGDYLEGSVDVVDFAKYDNATGNMADTLNYPLSLHIQRLNRLRAAIPALRKGQYSTEGCDGSFAYKRRYTDATTDSFAVIALTSDATFTGIPNGKYTDAITGDVKNVTNGTLQTTGIKGKGDLRVYVLDTELTKAPGVIEGYSDYMSGGADVVIETVKPTGIAITGENTATLDLGESFTFKAEISPADATNKIVSWSSSDTSVATVSKNGKVTGKGEGTATIYAATCNAEESDYTNQTALVAVATVTVKATGVKVTAIQLNKQSVSLEAGKAETITTTILPPNASSNYTALTWSSADTSIAKVNKNGVITAVKAGKTTVTVTTVSGASATVDVEVTKAVVHGDAMYFKKPSDMGSKIYAYIWSTDETYKNKAWPGESMILVDEEQGIYGVEWPDGQTDLNVIFSDGSSQTDDLKAVKNACLDSGGTVIESEVPTNPETEPSSEEPSSQEPSSQEPSSEEPSSQEPSSEEPSSQEPSSEEPSSQEPSSEEPSSQEPSSEEPSSEEPSSQEPSSEEPSSQEPSSEEPSSEEPSSQEPSSEEPSSEEPDTKPVSTLKITSFKASVANKTLEKGKTTKLQVKVKGGNGKIKYKFTAKRAGKTYTLKNYGTSSYMNWKPKKAGTYTLTVYAKDSSTVVKKSIKNYVVNETFKISSLKVNGGKKKAYVNKTIKMYLKATGGTKKYTYKYVYTYKGKKKTISGFSNARTVKWKPKKTGVYTITAYVKESGTGKVLKKTSKITIVK